MSGLERLLRPSSIATIGGLQASRVVEQCRLMGYAGDIWPIHPTRPLIGGRTTVPSPNDLPAAHWRAKAKEKKPPERPSQLH